MELKSIRQVSDSDNGGQCLTGWSAFVQLRSTNSNLGCRAKPRRVGISFRRGMSLLEIVLSLALSVMVFTAISVAIQTHLSSLTKQQSKIERKQIARAALGMIANDCRASFQYKAADFSGLDNLIKSQEMMMSEAVGQTGGEADEADQGSEEEDDEGGGSEDDRDGTGGAGGSGGTGGNGGTSGSGGTGGSGGAPASSEMTQSEEGESEGLYDESLVSFRPILIGSKTALMLDISRIPRLDQYSPLIASAASLAQSPSDIKSVAYFFSDTDGGVKSDIEFEVAAKGGLYRREIDRAVASYAGEEREISSPDTYTKLISPEVGEIEFRYFDGTEWKTAWNSEEEGGFPVAIEVTIVIDPARTSRNNLTYSYNGFDKETMEMFRTVVHLPLSEPKSP